MRRAVVSAALSVLLGVAAIAHGDPAPVAPAPPSATAVQQAHDLARAAIRLYEIGDYDEAIENFKKSFELDPNPAVVFNLAQAYRFKHDYPQAKLLFENFLRMLPRARNRADVQLLIAEMARKADADAAAARARAATMPTPMPATGPVEPVVKIEYRTIQAPAAELSAEQLDLLVQARMPPAKPIYKRPWVWAVVGGVVVAVAVGVAVGVTQTRSVLPSEGLGTIDGRK